MPKDRKEKAVKLKAINKCPKCHSVECEVTEKLFECEHIKITFCVCVNCGEEFVNYELKVSIGNMLKEMLKQNEM